MVYLLNMKIIITERQSIFLKRRLDQIEQFVKSAMRRVDPLEYSHLDDVDYTDEIIRQVIKKYSSKFDSNMVNEIEDYVRKNFLNDIESYFFSKWKSN